MPIKIPNELPATKVLNNENIFVITETRAHDAGHPPVADTAILNLMPTKDQQQKRSWHACWETTPLTGGTGVAANRYTQAQKYSRGTHANLL